MRLNDLAERMGISAPTASRAIDALVELGFVDRLRDPDDRRALRLGLTDAGQARASEREARVATAFAPALASLSRRPSATSSSRCWRGSRRSSVSSRPRSSPPYAQPAVCLTSDSRCCASSSDSLPLQTSRVQLVLDPVDRRGARVGLRPQVAWIGRMPAELEADQMVLLEGRGRPAQPVLAQAASASGRWCTRQAAGSCASSRAGRSSSRSSPA